MSLSIGMLLSSLTLFSSPVHYPIALAGNFGEPRLNHFHGGIDIKTGQVEGKAVYAIGNGYVSKAIVGLYGLGLAVYVKHPQGQTSVYCHLNRFAAPIAVCVKQWQYRHHSDKGEMQFRPTDLPVAEGQLIAFSGNSGASQAPHLHFEIHDSQSWDMLDPLDFIGASVVDSMAPLAHAFMAYPMGGTFCGSTKKQSFGFSSQHLTRKFTAWGKVGFGLWGNDYMEATYNRYGLREIKLLMDGRQVFHSNLSRIPVGVSRQVNAWGDYDHFLRYKIWYLRAFVPEGITLPALSTDKDRGICNFNEARDYHMTFLVADAKGNSREYTFTVTGKETPAPAAKTFDTFRQLRYNVTNLIQQQGAYLIVSPHRLPHDVELSPTRLPQPHSLSDAYRFHNVSLPLFGRSSICIRLNRKVPDKSKLYIRSKFMPTRFLGGIYTDGWVTTGVRELGDSYEIAYDDVPPLIHPVAMHTWNGSHILKFGITDTGSGLKHYEGYIDNRFILFEQVPKSSWVKCNLSDTPITPTGGLHTLKFIATDNRNNKQTFITKVIY